MIRKLRDHRRLFVLSKQPIVDQDASQLRADRFVKQRCCDRGIDPTREAADDSIFANHSPDVLHRATDKVAQMPTPFAICNVVKKVVDQRATKRSVRNLGMKLKTVNRQLLMPNRSMRASRCRC